MSYLYLKALHIIFVVTWFSGLFYIVRLYIYHTEANDKGQEVKDALQSQFKIMERRLWYGITWPSAVLTILFGLSLIHYFMPLKDNPWLMVKLGLVALLFLYHLHCGKIYKKLKNNEFPYSSNQLRMLNEVATLFLFSIVFLVVLKDLMNMVYGVVGITALSTLLFMAIQYYKKMRSKEKAS